MRDQSLVRLAMSLAVAGADIDEGAVEMMALSHRDRVLVAETISRLGYLGPGADTNLASEIVIRALRRGDMSRFWHASTDA